MLTELETKLLSAIKELIDIAPKDHERPDPVVGAKIGKLFKEIKGLFEKEMKIGPPFGEFIKSSVSC